MYNFIECFPVIIIPNGRKKSVDENGAKLLIDRLDAHKQQSDFATCFTYPEFIFSFYDARFVFLFFRGGRKKSSPLSCSTFDAFSLSWAILLSLIDIRIHSERTRAF
jgi:hypothetical protein